MRRGRNPAGPTRRRLVAAAAALLIVLWCAPPLEAQPVGRDAALAAFQQGDLGAAERLCTDWLRAHPKDAEVAQLLGMTRFRRALHAEAAPAAPAERSAAFEAALVALEGAERLADRTSPELDQALGYALFALGRYAEAAVRLDRLVATWPQQPLPRRLRGMLRLEQGRFSEAEADLRIAAEQAPQDLDTLRLHVRALTLLGRLEDAHAQLLAATARLPASGEGGFELLRVSARLSEDLRQFERARDELTRALALRDAAGARVDLGVLEYRLGAHAEAQRNLERALQGALSRAQRAQAQHTLGLVAQHAGRLAEARRHYEAALEQQPKRAETLQALAGVLQRLGETGRAREVAQQFASVAQASNRARQLESKLTLSPGDADARAELIGTLLTLERSDEAAEQLGRLRQNHPRHPALPKLQARLAQAESP